MSWPHFITLLSVIGFLVTASGLVGVSFKVGRNAQTVSNYRDSADAWEKKSHSQADEMAELNARLAANDIKFAANEATIKKLQDRVQVLEELVTGVAAITGLATKMDQSFVSLQMHIDEVAAQIIRGQHERAE